MPQKSPSKASEFLWLAVAFMTFVTGIHKTWNFGISTSWYFFGFTCISIAMYLLRKHMRENYKE